MKSPKNDYLKYWRVVRRFIRAKYQLEQSDLDMLLFLYSEKYFHKGKFKEFNDLLHWDNQRFSRLVKQGWIEPFNNTMGRKTMYKITNKTQTVIRSIYNKLNGEEIPTTPKANKLFAKDARCKDRLYKEMILKMNKSIQQQQHLSPE